MTSLNVILGALSVVGSLALPGATAQAAAACPAPALPAACQADTAAYVRDFRANWPRLEGTTASIAGTGQTIANAIRAGKTWPELTAIASRAYGPAAAPGVVSLVASSLTPGVPIKR